jgi:FkbM family methyltransferase
VDMLLKPFRDNLKLGISSAMSLPDAITGIDFSVFFCTLIKAELFKKIGLLDEIFSPGYGEDIDFCIKTKKLGYEIHSCINGWDVKQNKRTGDFPITHIGEGTMHDEIVFSRRYWDEHTAACRELLKERYWPVINVIIPVYQRYEKLKKALRSIEKQTFRRLKVHVVADGHDQKVENIVKSFNITYDKYHPEYDNIRPEYFYTYTDHEGLVGGQPRKSVLDSLPNVKNEYVCFIDSDNEVEPNYIQKLYQSIFLHEKEYGMAICKINHLEFHREIPTVWFNKPEFANIDSLNVLIRNDIAIKNSHLWIQKPNGQIDHDFLFIAKCAEQTKAVYINEVLGSHGQKDLTVYAFAVCRNEEKMLPYYLKHYEQIANKIIILEGGSTDSTLAILKAHPKVEIISAPSEKMDNFDLMGFRNEYYKNYKYDADFVIVSDIDELVLVDRKQLKEYQDTGITIPRIIGYQMVSPAYPANKDKQIYEQVRKGFVDPQWMNKSVIFNPGKVEINYTMGCHQCNPVGRVITSQDVLKLLHFKYIGYNEFINRSKANSERLSDSDLNNNLAFHYKEDAKMTMQDFWKLEEKSVDVFYQSLIFNRPDLEKQDPWVYYEIVTSNQYQAKKEDLAGKNVIDVGANIGLFSLLAREWGANEIIAVESNPDTWNALNENIEDANIMTMNRAVFGKDGEKVKVGRLPDYDKHDGKCWVIPNEDGNIETISLKTLIDCFKEKLSEFEIIYNTPPEDLLKCGIIFIELHENSSEFRGVNLTKDLRRYLETLGYQIVSDREVAPNVAQVCKFILNKVAGKKLLNDKALQKEREEIISNYEHRDRKLKDVQERDVTVGITTKNRYDILPLCLMSLINQTHKPKRVIIVDDTDLDKRVDLRNISSCESVLRLLNIKGIDWEVVYGPQPSKGTAWNRQHMLEKSTTSLMLRLDDDEVLEPTALEKMVDLIVSDPKIGAVAGLVLDPKSYRYESNYYNDNKMSDIFTRENTQWVNQPPRILECEHLYSTFLHRKIPNVNYCLELSQVAHREESLFSHEIFRQGYRLLVDTSIITWHIKEPTGGIRTFNDPKLWEHDENIFKRKMASWSIDLSGKKLIVSDLGLGDQLVMLKIMPKLMKKYPNLVFATNYPNVFTKEFPTLHVIPAVLARDLISHKDADNQNVYKLLWDKSVQGKKLTLQEGFEQLADIL